MGSKTFKEHLLGINTTAPAMLTFFVAVLEIFTWEIAESRRRGWQDVFNSTKMLSCQVKLWLWGTNNKMSPVPGQGCRAAEEGQERFSVPNTSSQSMMSWLGVLSGWVIHVSAMSGRTRKILPLKRSSIFWCCLVGWNPFLTAFWQRKKERTIRIALAPD